MRSLLRVIPLAALVSSSLPAQSSWRDHADAARLRQVTDSFTVMVRGNAVGWQRLSWMHEGRAQNVEAGRAPWKPLAGSPAAPTWIMSDEVALSGIQQRSEVRFTSALVEHGLRQTGSARGTEMRITLDREGDRMTGSALTPTGGPTAIPMDVAVTDDVIDDNALSMILPAIRWADGLTFTIPVLSSGKGTIGRFTATVTGKGATTVPAGTFDTWRIMLDGGEYAVLAEVTTARPYRVVRITPRGSPMDIQLAR